MLDWIKDKLGITDLEDRVEHSHLAIGRIERKVGMAQPRTPQRHDEIERDRKRRRKGGNS